MKNEIMQYEEMHNEKTQNGKMLDKTMRNKKNPYKQMPDEKLPYKIQFWGFRCLFMVMLNVVGLFYWGGHLTNIHI